MTLEALDGFIRLVLFKEGSVWRASLRLINIDVDLIAWEIQMVNRCVLHQASTMLKVALMERFVVAAHLAKCIESDTNWTTLWSLHLERCCICCILVRFLAVIVLIDATCIYFHMPWHVLSETSLWMRCLNTLRESLVLQSHPRFHFVASLRSHSHSVCNS